ncbi:hypothetical protein QBC36DRAFT_201019 [Triangularia setosa]|uniref:Chromo domain-containing protein n=1 Tax=Triangularia setosa TaxID=2587417 RepID=A0AAN6VWH2_9PEZI|nr:hypothetical protein QBC36DRAFT_201019 [Podospora setosa]
MEQYLRAYCSYYQDDWVDWLPLAEFTSNNYTSETTGLSPFFANYGWHPRMGTEPFLKAGTAAERIKRVTARCQAFMTEAQENQAHYADTHRQQHPAYTEGELVWVNTRYLASGRPVTKLDDRWRGPYKVTKVYPKALAVELPPGSKAFPVFHTSLVKEYEKGIPGQEAANEEFDRRAAGVAVMDRGGNTTEEEGEEWFFEKILNSRLAQGALEYRVKWPHPHRPTWEPAANLNGCNSDIEEFHKANPSKPGPLGAQQPARRRRGRPPRQR